MHRRALLVLDVAHGAVELCVDGVFDLLGVAAHAQYHADVEAVDECGGTTTADEWQWLPCDGEEAYGYCHVDHGLGDKQQRQAHDKEGGEVALATARYASGPEQ